MIAILAILMTLLSPSLNSITSASRSLVCSQNQSKLGTYISSYSFDNDDHFTPPGQRGKVWDDYLFGYDGRDQVLENWNVNFAYGDAPFSWGRWVDISGQEALFSTYECPEDPSEEFYPILKSLPARTYQINAHGGPWMRGVGWIDKAIRWSMS